MKDFFIKRTLNLESLLQKKSHFLLGPRSTGKTKLIEMQLQKSYVIDLLQDKIYSRLLREPSLLADMIPENAHLVVIDEIQKIPALLDEVHRLIEKRKIKFLLTGSSARKLRKGGTNLLGGRAWEADLFPLTWRELGKDFSLKKYLNYGGLPSVYFSDYPTEELKNYIKLYLKEEILSEAVVKRFDHFTRFLDVAALTSGEELNFDSLSSDAAVPARTVANYFQVLEDTLLGFQLKPFAKTKKRKAISRSKFYIFDVGVAAALAQRGEIQSGTELWGKAFEQFIIQEVRAYLSYSNLDMPMQYWRSKSQFEVDLVVGSRFALEIKSGKVVSDQHLKGLKALQEEKLIQDYFLVSADKINRTKDGIQIINWEDFLQRLWSGKFK